MVERLAIGLSLIVIDSSSRLPLLSPVIFSAIRKHNPTGILYWHDNNMFGWEWKFRLVLEFRLPIIAADVRAACYR